MNLTQPNVIRVKIILPAAVVERRPERRSQPLKRSSQLTATKRYLRKAEPGKKSRNERCMYQKRTEKGAKDEKGRKKPKTHVEKIEG